MPRQHRYGTRSRTHGSKATSTRLPALNKIKKLDAADSKLKISYALITLGTNGWPSVSTIKSVGTAAHAKHTIPAAVVRSYRLANITVCLFTGRTPPTTQK
jgi:hypothetical protein